MRQLISILLLFVSLCTSGQNFFWSHTSSIIATVTTSPVTNIGLTTATGGGTVVSDGGSPVTERGICWSTFINPNTSNTKVISGTGTGSFTGSITGLLCANYFVRAYAINANGTAYGGNVSFVPVRPLGLPDVSFLISINSVPITTANVCTITYDGLGGYGEYQTSTNTTEGSPVYNGFSGLGNTSCALNPDGIYLKMNRGTNITTPVRIIGGKWYYYPCDLPKFTQ